MSTAEPYNSHHPFQTFSVMSLVLLGVGGAAYVSTGGYGPVKQKVERMIDTTFGVKNIELNSVENPNKTSVIGISASGCLETDGYGVHRVRKTSKDPEVFTVYVRRIGEGALNAASVEACVFKETSTNIDVVVQK